MTAKNNKKKLRFISSDSTDKPPFFLLFLSLYGAYHVHQLHEEGIVFQHRKFVGDFSNMAKDMDVIGDKEEVKEVAPLINRDKGFLSSVLKIPALEMGNGDEVVADDNVIVSVISSTLSLTVSVISSTDL